MRARRVETNVREAQEDGNQNPRFRDTRRDQPRPIDSWGRHHPFTGCSSGDTVRVLAHKAGALMAIDGQAASPSGLVRDDGQQIGHTHIHASLEQ